MKKKTLAAFNEEKRTVPCTPPPRCAELRGGAVGDPPNRRSNRDGEQRCNIDGDGCDARGRGRSIRSLERAAAKWVRRGARYLLAHTVCEDARSRVSLEISEHLAAGAFV
jgi:hypothetical protein